MHTLDELGPSKLLDEEQDRIRHAADNLIFASDLEADGLAQAALDDTVRLCRSLVESGRWEKVTAAQLGSATGIAALLLVAALTTGTTGHGSAGPVIAWATAAAIAGTGALAFAIQRQPGLQPATQTPLRGRPSGAPR